jgi:CBS domain-containing protein
LAIIAVEEKAMFDFDVRSGNEPPSRPRLDGLGGLTIPRELLAEPVTQVRRRAPVMLLPACPARDALARMAERHARAALVASHGVLLGTLTERDVVRRLIELPAGSSLAEAPVFQLMSSEPDTLLDTDSVGYAIRKLWSLGGQPLPIVRPTGALLGLLESQDILAWIADRVVPPGSAGGNVNRDFSE